MINITNINSNSPKSTTFFQLGFRPMFFTASVFAVVFMLLFLIFYRFESTHMLNTAIIYWHAHEMIYAYIIAIIAGFLLTAIRNWTKLNTLSGKYLAALLLLWIIARLLPFIKPLIEIQMVIDVSFLVFLTIAISIPILKAKNWNNLSIILKVALLVVAHIIFYLGLLGYIENGIIMGLYLGFYLILSIVFLMARRVIPFFIGSAANVKIKNYKVIDSLSLILFLLYMILEVFFYTYTDVIIILAFSLFIIHSIRLYNWFTKDIFKTPLLWSLYISYAFITFGFLLKIIEFYFGYSPYLHIHAFALGMVLLTLAMMSRISLAHSGLSIFKPPRMIKWAFILMIFSFIFRVILPIIFVYQFKNLVIISQFFWIAAFIVFLIAYTPIFIKQYKF